jgi:8-oxo-dGTP pyrophosphatase MutT (NUDIX family)
VDSLARVLLSPEEAQAMNAPGGTDAAVLVPLFGHPERPGLVFTERRLDLSRHAGEISFPGGRQDTPDEPLLDTALREADEEIGLSPDQVAVAGALPPVGTFVTGYKVHPFVGTIEPGYAWTPQETEVAEILELSLPELIRGFESKRLLKKGVPIKTPTYTVDGHFVWGATARIVESLLQRLDPVLGPSS